MSKDTEFRLMRFAYKAVNTLSSPPSSDTDKLREVLEMVKEAGELKKAIDTELGNDSLN